MKPAIKNYFDSYPESSECFESADGFIFHKKNDAVAYASTLEDKTVLHHKPEVTTTVEPPAHTTPVVGAATQNHVSEEEAAKAAQLKKLQEDADAAKAAELGTTAPPAIAPKQPKATTPKATAPKEPKATTPNPAKP